MTDRIRAAVPADGAAVAALHVDGWQVGFRGLVSDEHLASLSVEDHTRGWTAALTDGAHIRLFERDSDPVGFVLVEPSSDPDLAGTAGELTCLYVRSDSWRDGIGGHLVDAAVAALNELGFRELALWVYRDNTRARRFYDKHGWQPDGTSRTDTRPGVLLPEVRYRLTT